MIEQKISEKKFYNLISNTYDMQNRKIMEKYLHSLSVAYLMKKYANIMEKDGKLAFNIGLLHDIGRFYQLSRYNTYNDKESLNHALYGNYILFTNKLIEYFAVDPKYYPIIKEAIAQHNKYKLPNINWNKETIFYIKLLRDCDKIAIISDYIKVKLYTDKYAAKKEDDISIPVKKSLEKYEQVKYLDIKNSLDQICSNISYLFDMNFSSTSNDFLTYVEIILDNLKRDSRYNIVKNNIESYKLERMK